MNQKRLETRLIDDAHAFYHHGWMMGTSGNLSARLGEERFVVTASGRNKGELSEDDFLVCDLEAAPVESTDAKPSSDTAIHAVVYDLFSEAGAVYHVHHMPATLCSVRDKEKGHTRFEAIAQMKGLSVWEPGAIIDVPILENAPYGDALAPNVRAHLKDRRYKETVPALNVHRHGLYVWGETAFEARRHLESLAYLYEFSWELQ